MTAEFVNEQTATCRGYLGMDRSRLIFKVPMEVAVTDYHRKSKSVIRARSVLNLIISLTRPPLSVLQKPHENWKRHVSRKKLTIGLTGLWSKCGGQGVCAELALRMTV